ncbi:MAG: cyclic nucleotide-binding domain-containing protein, partial [Duncaniella sp.]|nr:cyclic nucleotide-binding domain-containing protein [Duncaniella sp.]
MIKSAIEQVITEDLSEIWQILSGEEKRLVIENFHVHHYKKNQIIYAEKDDPEYLWCLLEGKVKKYKDGIGGRVQIIRLIKPVQYFGYR